MKRNKKKLLGRYQHKEDAIDVEMENAAYRYKDEDVARGVTDTGGNASADVRMPGKKLRVRKNRK